MEDYIRWIIKILLFIGILLTIERLPSIINAVCEYLTRVFGADLPYVFMPIIIIPFVAWIGTCKLHDKPTGIPLACLIVALLALLAAMLVPAALTRL